MSKKSWLWLLPAGCLILFLAVGLCVGSWFFLRVSSSDKGQPRKVATAFLEALQDGRYDEAWSQLSEDVQARYQNQTVFEKKARRLRPVAVSFRDEELDNESAVVTMSTSFRSSGWEAIVHYPTVLYLRKESGEWKIYDITGALEPLINQGEPAR